MKQKNGRVAFEEGHRGYEAEVGRRLRLQYPYQSGLSKKKLSS